VKRQPNVSNADRVVRLILGGAALGLGIAFWPVGAIVGALLAAALWISAWTGYCHVYDILGISTLKR
jgi:hypothetical protein